MTRDEGRETRDQRHEMIIAIDGPAGSGKTSTARAVARELGYTYLDTGAMYRAITLAAIRAGVPMTDAAVSEAAGRVQLDIRYDEGDMRVFLDGADVTEEIRSREVNERVSQVSAYAFVRDKMVEAQRGIARRIVEHGGGVVVDGRDIGTVVFPEAELKLFMQASPEVRARRRYDELVAAGIQARYEDVLENVVARDAFDSSRDIAPLKKAADAIEVDTSSISFTDQVSLVVNKVLERQVGSDV